jgi:UDP-2,3-diacylglucosamine hydrolase
MSSAQFISDLHLSEDQPAILRRFLDFLDIQARETDALYILGDLFDAWIGDDEDSACARSVINGLRHLADSGTSVFVMHGNRDFLIGKDFCNAAGATLLADPSVIQLNDQRILLTHGDQLCTLDETYQAARKQRCQQEWIDAFLVRSLDQRRQAAAVYLKMSGESKSLLAEDIMDVSPEAVNKWFSKYATPLMIHGHTHRPADHTHRVNGKDYQRSVLDQWYPDRGMYLEIRSESGLQRHYLG